MPRDSSNRISTDEVLKAYSLGYFPMARSREDEGAVWVLPDERGVLLLDEAHLPRRLRRFMRREPFRVTVNHAFQQVIAACAEETAVRDDTWINDAIIEAYTELHFEGFAHSVECWNGDRLVGGLYGVALGGAFCGESMFTRETNASKVALAWLMALAKAGGFQFIDAQFVNEHLEQFGFRSFSNDQYQDLLRKALRRPARLADINQFDTSRVLQSITQTS